MRRTTLFVQSFLYFLFAFCISAGSFCSDEVPSIRNWSWKITENGIEVCFDLGKGHFAYADETEAVMLTPTGERRPADILPRAERHADIPVYTGPGKYIWVFHSAEEGSRVAVRWQVCSEAGQCFLPGEGVLSGIPSKRAEEEGVKEVQNKVIRYRVLRSASGYMSPDEFQKFLHGGEGIADFFAGRGILAVFLLTFLGGIALNLTPCVLPLLPVNLAIIGAGRQEGRRGKKVFLGMVYGAGMMIACGVFGLVVSLTGSAFFGNFASNGYFNSAAALIFILLGLAMFDVIRFEPASWFAGIRFPDRMKWFTVFLAGGFSAIMAGSCVAPAVAAVLLESAALFNAGDWSGLLLPFVLGAGMALPWPLAAAGLSLFPKPGAWMVHVKQVLGILILLPAAFCLWQAYLYFQPDGRGKGVGAGDSAYEAIQDGLAEAAMKKKVVLLDFGASWCKNCAAMEWNAFRDPEVKKTLEKMIVVKIRAEDPKEPSTAALLREFDVPGLPHYVMLEPSE